MEFKTFDLAQAYGNAQNIAANQHKLKELAEMSQAKEGLKQAVSGGKEAFDLYRKQYPAYAREWEAGTLKLNSEQLKLANERAGYIGQLASGVSDEQSYQDALRQAEAAGIPIDQAPKNYDPAWVQQTVQQALSIKERLALMGKDDSPPLEVYDENSPTGTRFVKRKDAIGKPGKPPSGFSVDIDPETGKVTRIAQGRGAQKDSPRTKGEVQDRILKGGDTMGQLRSIDRLYRPEFQQIGSRWNNYVSRLKDKAGVDLEPNERKNLEEFTKYRAEAAQLFSLTLKDLSGVAVNPTEFERAKSWLPTPGSGIFDGDSPSELEAKRQRFEDFTRRALIKYNYINKNGLSKNDIDVDDIPVIVQKRGDELATELKRQGLQGEDLKRKVKTLLSDEFGFGLIQ